jgi:hypothetical protein
MEQGIAENVLEMALRGKPREPFYMVGRMEGQSVVLRAEKGKLRLMVDDEQVGTTRFRGGGRQEMVYEVPAKEEESDRSLEREDRDGKSRETEGGEVGNGGEEKAESFGIYGGGEMPCGLVGMDGETQTRGGLSGVGSRVEIIERGVVLNPRLAVLLERKSKGGAMKRLERRLVRLQEGPAKPGELREIGA